MNEHRHGALPLSASLYADANVILLHEVCLIILGLLEHFVAMFHDDR